MVNFFNIWVFDKNKAVGRFGRSLGNPEVIDALVIKIYKKIKGPKKYTMEEVQKINELLKKISILENTMKMNENKYNNGSLIEKELCKQTNYEIERAIDFTKFELSSLIND